MRRKRRPPPRAHSISCTDAEWERVRVLAERRGLSMSRYFVECGLTVDPTTEAPKPPRLVLDEAEQRRLVDTVVRISPSALRANRNRRKRCSCASATRSPSWSKRGCGR